MWLVIPFLLLPGSGPASAGTTVACLGDTRTGIASEGYAARLEASLGSGYRVRDLGRAGRPVATLWEDAAASLRQDPPQVVVVHAGSADADASGWGERRDGFVPAVRRLLRSLRELPGSPVVAVTLPDPEAFAADAPARGRVESELRPLLSQAAREEGVALIELKGTAASPDFVAEAVATAVGDPAVRRRGWTVAATSVPHADDAPPSHAIDGRLDTFWLTRGGRRARRHPHELTVDMGQEITATALRYVPRPDGGEAGRVARFELHLSRDGRRWGKPVVRGRLPDQAEASWIRFAAPVQARFFRFRSRSVVSGGRVTSAAEIAILAAPRGR